MRKNKKGGTVLLISLAGLVLILLAGLGLGASALFKNAPPTAAHGDSLEAYRSQDNKQQNQEPLTDNEVIGDEQSQTDTADTVESAQEDSEDSPTFEETEEGILDTNKDGQDSGQADADGIPPNNADSSENVEAAQAELPLHGLVIGIDAGHQAKGNNEHEQVSPDSSETKPKVSSGTQGVASGVPEYVVNLDISLLLQKKLQELGAKTVMVRETHDVDISNQRRATMMNDEAVDLCIRVHANGSANKSVQGAMMLVPHKNITPEVDEKSYEAGEIIFASFLDATGAKDAGIIYRTDLTGFNWSKVPVCLIELGFMSNPDEDLLLVNPDYQEKCAVGLTDGIVNWWLSLNKE